MGALAEASAPTKYVAMMQGVSMEGENERGKDALVPVLVGSTSPAHGLVFTEEAFGLERCGIPVLYHNH